MKYRKRNKKRKSSEQDLSDYEEKKQLHTQEIDIFIISMNIEVNKSDNDSKSNQ